MKRPLTFFLLCLFVQLRTGANAQKLSALPVLTSADTADRIVVLDTSASAAKTITVGNLLISAYQPLDSDLTAIAALATTGYGRSLLAQADAAAARSALALVPGADVQAYHASLAAIAAGTWTGAASLTTLGTISTGTWAASTIPIARGGTGQTSASAALTALLPAQAGESGKVLTSDGTAASWAAPAGGGGGTLPPLGAALSPSGNDTTGTLGDASKPYATIQAAYDDGARDFLLRPGAAADGDLADGGGAIIITIASEGSASTHGVIRDITSSSNIVIEAIAARREAVELRDIIGDNDITLTGCTVRRIEGSGADGVADGAGPVSAGTVTLRNVWVNDYIHATGGNGAAMTDADGQAGGVGGSVFLDDRSSVNNAVTTAGGSGGLAAPTTSSGAGGAGGEVHVDGNSAVYGNINTIGGAAGGNDFGGPIGVGGNCGPVTLTGQSTATQITAIGGSGSSNGSDGPVTLRMSTVTVGLELGGGTLTVAGAIIADVFYANSYP